jgi:hypothetical protein
MYDKKMTLTGMGAFAAYILCYALKHIVGLDVPDEVGQSIVILGIALLGKFGRDSSKITNAHDDAANAVVKQALDGQAACVANVDNMTKGTAQ